MDRTILLIVLSVGLLWGASTGIAAAASVESGLVLTGQNTVILDRSVYAGRWLQFYLIRAVAKHPDAMAWTPDAKKDRSLAPAFALYKREEDVPSGKHMLIVGPVDRLGDYLDEQQRDRLVASHGSLLVKRNGDHVVICHTGGPWDLAAIRIFLDKCAGVRLYAPTAAEPSADELWLSMPASDHIALGSLDIFKKPYFAKTTFSSGGHERNREWLRMNSIVSGGLDLRASHTIIRYFKPDTYYDTHPQLYPMHANGTRPRPIGDAWNPCFADPELAARIAMGEVRKIMEGNRPPSYLSFGVMDTHYDCKCPVCQASLKKHDGDAANLWYDFLNRVARQCQQEYPGLYLTSYSYANVSIPTGIRLEPNIVIDNVIKSYLYTDQAAWAQQTKEMRAFAGLGAQWVTHDWNFQGVTPRIYSRQLASFLQWGAQNGMLGIYTEWSGREYWYLNGANYWVLRQLLSDPYQDPDLLWRQYCQDMFGEGWELMYRFYDSFQQKHVVGDRFFVKRDWPREEVIGYTAEDLAAQRRWLESAMALTRHDPLVQRRLAAIMRYFQAHELLAQATGMPGRLYHQFRIVQQAPGINKDALAFYVNDDGSKLHAFEEYYEQKRTIAPDSNIEDKQSSLRFSYRNNYSRALGDILKTIKEQAMQDVDPQTLDKQGTRQLVEKMIAIYRENLPERYDSQRADDIEELLAKVLWAPNTQVMPVLDGDLSDEAWQHAAELRGWSLADLLLPTAQGNTTRGRIMRVGNHLVIGLVCSQPNGIWAQTPADIHTGTRIWRETSCEIFFGPLVAQTKGEPLPVAQYIINALGAYRGFRAAQDNRQDVDVAVKLSEDGKAYTIEAALPLKVEGVYDFTQARTLSFNIMRNPFYADTFNSTERIGWAPIFFTAQNPDSRGMLVMD